MAKSSAAVVDSASLQCSVLTFSTMIMLFGARTSMRWSPAITAETTFTITIMTIHDDDVELEVIEAVNGQHGG